MRRPSYQNSDSDSEMRASSLRKSYQVPKARSNMRDPYMLEKLNEPELSDNKYSSLMSSSKRLPSKELGTKESTFYDKNEPLSRSMKLVPLNLHKSHSDEDIRDRFKKPALINSSRDSTETKNNSLRKNTDSVSNMQIMSYDPYAARKANYDNYESEKYDPKARQQRSEKERNKSGIFFTRF